MLAALTLPSPRRAPARRDREPRHAGLVGAGHVLEVRRGDHRLAAGRAQQLDQRPAAVAVELAHHVVEQHQRRRLAAIGDRLALGQQQRQQRQPLLALGAVGAQLAARRARATRSSRCGPWPVKPRSRSQSSRSASSAASSVGVARPRARAVARAPARRRARARRSSAANGSATPSTARAAVGHQRDPVPRELRVPARERAPRRRRPHRIRAISALRCASACAYARRVATRAGHSAATNWSRCARRTAGAPLISSSRSGRKTLTSGRSVDVEQPLDRAPRRRASASARPGAKPTDSSCGPSSPRRVDHDPRRALRRSGPPRARSSVRHERPVQPKYSASSRFVLPAPFGPGDHGQAGAELAVRRVVAAEVAQR